MKLADRFSSLATLTLQAFASIVKIAVMSKRCSPAVKRDADSSIAILGNGPSLVATMENSPTWLKSMPSMAVNFAATTPQWEELKPEYYILADPHFFNGEEDKNVAKLWESLRNASWPFTLFVPVAEHKATLQHLKGSNVEVKTFNLTPVEGPKALCRIAYQRGLGMPRPRNVLIPAIMTAIREGFSNIYLCGADHSWTKTLSVDDANRVVSIQPHFYEDNDEEHSRVAAVYSGVKLHDMLYSLTVAFRSYFAIADYAEKNAVKILNATPGSFIDAFPRFIPPKG